MTPTPGAYPLTGVRNLPNVDIASPGEVWSNLRANGAIVPGAAILPVSVGGERYAKQIGGTDTVPDKSLVGVALRQIATPDLNPGSLYNPALGPNEIVNLPIADLDYLRRYMSGVLHLTLVSPRSDYEPGQLVGWDKDATRPVGKGGVADADVGAWSNQAGDIVTDTDIFEVFEYREFGTSNEGILTVRFLRSNQ